MSKLHFFYPENDNALALGQANYTGSAAAVLLRESGSALAMWTGLPGDRFITQGINNIWYERISGAFGLDVDVYDGNPTGLIPWPWGWSLPVRKVYENNGFKKAHLPGDNQINILRELSHRKTSLILARTLKEKYGDICGVPGFETTQLNQVKCKLQEGEWMIKQPWSSSGRGIMLSSELEPNEVLRRVAGIIRHQGSVIMEPYHGGLHDFALLYDYGDGKARFVGLSVFEHDRHFAYTSSLVAEDEILLKRLREKDVEIPEDLAVSTGEALTEILKNGYSGALGVDFVGGKKDGHIFFSPVEVNLRQTMGHVAHRLSETCLAQGEEAVMTIEKMKNTPYGKGAGPLDLAVIKTDRLVSGMLLLNPPESGLAFVLRVK